MEKMIDILSGMQLIFTDEPEKAKKLADSGLCFITIAGICDGAAAYVEKAEDFDELNDSFLERVCCRHYHKPYILFHENEKKLRECDKTDYEYVTELLKKNREAVIGFEDSLWTDDITAAEQFEKTIRDYYILTDFGLWILEIDGHRAGIFGLSAEADGIELYYILADEYRGQNLAFDICSFICEYAREELAVDKLWIRCSEQNKPSRHLAERLGFKLYSSEADGGIAELKFINEL